MSGHPVRLAVVGGRRGGAFNLAIEHLKEKLALVAVCDPSEAMRARWREEHPDIQAFASFEGLLAAEVCDAILLATPVQLHADQAVAALEAGLHVLSEVPACLTHAEATRLIDAVRRTGRTYMMAENYCYMRPHMMVRYMVEQGVFGELTYAEGMYLHDCRGLKFTAEGASTWRGDLARDMPACNYYPTHSFGPIAQWLGINREDRITSVYAAATPALSSADYTARRFGADHPGAHPGHWLRGDGASCLIRTEMGRVISLRIDTASPRPHHPTTHELQGTNACYRTPAESGQDPLIWIDGASVGANPPRRTDDPDLRNGEPMRWDSLWRHADRYEHPRWRRWGQAAAQTGHGGGDFFVLEDFVRAITGEAANPIDVYDAVTWSSLIWLSAQSIQTGQAVPATDYRRPG